MNLINGKLTVLIQKEEPTVNYFFVIDLGQVVSRTEQLDQVEVKTASLRTANRMILISQNNPRTEKFRTENSHMEVKFSKIQQEEKKRRHR